MAQLQLVISGDLILGRFLVREELWYDIKALCFFVGKICNPSSLWLFPRGIMTVFDDLNKSQDLLGNTGT